MGKTYLKEQHHVRYVFVTTCTSGAVNRQFFINICAFCDCIGWIDIVLKLFLGYYDKRGILIFDKKMCVTHYLSRGFLMDIIGSFPWYEVLRSLMSGTINDHSTLMINTACKFAHLYIVIGYFNYISDSPTMKTAYIMILKWQIVTILAVFGASQFFLGYCIRFNFNANFELVSMTYEETCFKPRKFLQGEQLNSKILHEIYVDALQLAQNGLMGWNYGHFIINRNNIAVGIVSILLMWMYWLILGYTLTMLVLSSRGNTLFQHGVRQLQKFLAAERVDRTVIEHAVAYFSYWWVRTKGINIQHLANERLGVVFRQDLSYYFFQRTLSALDTLLQGGENLERQLASASVQTYILHGQEIIREMDLTFFIYVVHKGKIIISQKGEIVNSLGMGSIFGQMESTTLRPVRISAKADGYADLLQIHIKDFQDIINDDIRKIIANNFQAKSDYMATKRYFVEDSYETIPYILRGRKKIMLPNMLEPLEAAEGNWYSKWLCVAWLWGPIFTNYFVFILKTLEQDQISGLYWFFGFSDLICLTHVVLEFFTIDLEVINKKCVHSFVGIKHLKRVDFYLDVITLLVPLLTILTGDVNYQLIRVLRLRHLYKFHVHFCLSFESNLTPMILKICIIFMLLHCMSCGFVLLGCRHNKFPYEMESLPDDLIAKVDPKEWVLPKERNSKGCPRLICHYVPEVDGPGLVVPRHWYTDFIMSMSYTLFFVTTTPIDNLFLLTINEVYYVLIITFIGHIMEIWFKSVTITYVYTKFRELYQYDYNVGELITYLQDSGMAPPLINVLVMYNKQLWARQRGNWLPELAMQAPKCLREDLFSELYMHHLERPPVLRDLPFYFRRQLAARIRRLVVFPGKWIIREGDIYPCMYFIHEGEVEKWYIDKSGENKMMGLLTTNGYFGLVPGLFPNFPYQFSYYTRTVADLVLLRLENWQDLIDGYPDLKRDMYAAAMQLRRDVGTIVT